MFQGVTTRFPLLLPIPRTDDVVKTIINAIDMNKPKVLMPFVVHTVPVMRLLPLPVFERVAESFAVTGAMGEFAGRHKSAIFAFRPLI